MKIDKSRQRTVKMSTQKKKKRLYVHVHCAAGNRIRARTFAFFNFLRLFVTRMCGESVSIGTEYNDRGPELIM